MATAETEPDSPAAPSDFRIHHRAEETVLRARLVKSTDRHQHKPSFRNSWFLSSVRRCEGKHWV